ncbi:MAG: 3-hydroxyacyl-ACP dehydratase FabZ [Desulfovibrionaceae bacterium]|nr:3-hydroxyacyl-ACP dehydratase FabZ [Desulfovibrionaceae bacterium]
MSEATFAFNINEILKYLPHRYPFLLIDRVVECVPGKTIKAYKNVTVNENFFPGHFPENPIMPGVLIMEAMAQAGGVMMITAMEQDRERLLLFTGLDKVRFRSQVIPGDRLDIECTLLRSRMNLHKMETKAYVDGRLVAEAELSAAIIEKENA